MALRFASCNFAGEGAEAVFPEAAELVDPGVNVLKRFGIDRIDAPASLSADADETAFAQRTEVLRNSGLRDAELVPDDLREASGALLAAGEEFQNPASHRVAEDVEGFHGVF
jgi:hypothetical protein